MDGYIHSTESFGTVDGPGTRFVIFFCGCPMRCLYCHNPDTWTMQDGTLRSEEDLLTEYEGVKTLLRNGGITATGGEPLLQLDFLISLFEAAKARGISTCLDTSGICFRPGDSALVKQYDRLLRVTDLVMLDIKHIDDDAHRKLTGHSNRNILAFLDYLQTRGEDVWIRHVVVPEVTLKEEPLFRLGETIGRYDNVKALDVIPYHTMARPKYEKLGLDYPLGDIPDATKDQALLARGVILRGMRVSKLTLKK